MRTGASTYHIRIEDGLRKPLIQLAANLDMELDELVSRVVSKRVQQEDYESLIKESPRQATIARRTGHRSYGDVVVTWTDNVEEKIAESAHQANIPLRDAVENILYHFIDEPARDFSRPRSPSRDVA